MFVIVGVVFFIFDTIHRNDVRGDTIFEPSKFQPHPLSGPQCKGCQVKSAPGKMRRFHMEKPFGEPFWKNLIWENADFNWFHVFGEAFGNRRCWKKMTQIRPLLKVFFSAWAWNPSSWNLAAVVLGLTSTNSLVEGASAGVQIEMIHKIPEGAEHVRKEAIKVLTLLKDVFISLAFATWKAVLPRCFLGVDEQFLDSASFSKLPPLGGLFHSTCSTAAVVHWLCRLCTYRWGRRWWMWRWNCPRRVWVGSKGRDHFEWRGLGTRSHTSRSSQVPYWRPHNVCIPRRNTYWIQNPRGTVPCSSAEVNAWQRCFGLGFMVLPNLPNPKNAIVFYLCLVRAVSKRLPSARFSGLFWTPIRAIHWFIGFVHGLRRLLLLNTVHTEGTNGCKAKAQSEQQHGFFRRMELFIRQQCNWLSNSSQSFCDSTKLY